MAPKLPQEFKEKVKAPKIDKTLLDNMGVEDTVFIDWLTGLDINPLFEEALNRTLRAIGYTGNAKFQISNGELAIKAQFMTPKEKQQLETAAKNVGERFQIEVLAIIAQLLDYTTMTSNKVIGGKKTTIVEGEKNESADVHRYLSVAVGSNGNGVLTFEHFESKSVLKEERAKLMLLAQKFGIKIRFSEEHESGQPIATGVEHHDFLKQR
ncbi:MAG TPA: hypothetical protein DEG18_00170 [Candidatus Yanofskybacteria bacterium]|nr:MAG: hypothetical protein A2371_00025 [Candidatus Yanofskybacteria bacterium RIFOXYB1_FULL_44_29]HBX58014.1 hypothetical protein [Candidatus Yanofskybacteria bacterium]